MCVNKLILGDNLEIMKTMESETVDLIYLDPPFFSNRTYEVIWGDDGEKRSFEDRFAGGIDHYIHWLKLRVREMHRVLKPTGSIFLHCDWHADAYIRVHILDTVFGRNNFRNEIVWGYKRPSAPNQKQLSRLHDNIFWYSKSSKLWIFNGDDIKIPYAKSSIARAGYAANVSKMTDGEIGRRTTLRGWRRLRCASSSLVLGTMGKAMRCGYFSVLPFLLKKNVANPQQVSVTLACSVA